MNNVVSLVDWKKRKAEEEINIMGFALLFFATFLTLWSGIKYLVAGLKTFDS